MALIRLHTCNYNHRTRMIVNLVQQENGVRYGVLLTGETEAAAIRLVNLRLVYYTARFAAPRHWDSPQERCGNSTAQVVVFKPADVQIEGAHYQSSEWCTMPEENKDYSSVTCNIVLNRRAGIIIESDDGTENETIDKSNQSMLAQQSRPDTDQLE